MTLLTHMAEVMQANAINLDIFGEAITYTPIGGAAITRTVVIDRAPLDPMMWDDGTGTKVTAEIHIANDAVSGVTDPGLGDAVAFDSTTFAVRDITRPDGDGLWKLSVVKVDVDEKGGIRKPGR